MATEIIMPKAGMAMEEGKIVRWLKNVGDKVEASEGIMEIETDKITMEHECPVDGVLLAKLYEDGETIPVVTVIGYVGQEGEVVPERSSPESREKPVEPVSGEAKIQRESIPSAESRTLATPYAKKLAEENNVDINDVVPGRGGIVKAGDVRANVKVKATPLVARMAADKGIDLSQIKGSGFGGKITSGDLPEIGDTRRPATAMRMVIAKRMLGSHLSIPPVTQNNKVYVDELLALREKMNEGKENKDKISINDMVIKASALAVAEFPAVRTELDEEKWELTTRPEVNIAVAVALDEGLIVPVIMGADKLSLGQISAKAKDLAARAKKGTLLPGECSGSTFTISNLGAFGIHTFTPIINQPNAAILGVNCINDELAMVDGKVVSRKYMMLSLTFDHRILDGATAAMFQNRIKQLMENFMEFLI